MRPDILMLVNNDWRMDSRVIREAESLVRGGYSVEVVCRRQSSEVIVDECNGVRYHCVPYAQGATTWRRLAPVRIHLGLWFQLSTALMGRDQYANAARCVGLALSQLVTWSAYGIVVGLNRLLDSAVNRGKAIVLWRPNDKLGRQPTWLAARIASRSGIIVTFPRAKVNEWWSRALQGPIYLNQFAAATESLIEGLKPCLIHAHDLVTLSAAFRIGRRLNIPFLYDAHELETHTNYWSLTESTYVWIKRYERQLIKFVVASITVCDSIADWLSDHYEIPRPVVVMNAPRLDIPSAHTLTDGRSVRGDVQLPTSTPLMVYVGSITVDRGLEVCVRALVHMPRVHFALVGPAYQPIVDELRKIAMEADVQERLHILAPVPSEQVIEFVRDADCSVVAIQNVCLSYYFCFPNKLLESVFAGMPVAVASLAELERFIGKFPVGKVMDERSPQSIAEAVTNIIDNPSQYRPTAEQLRLIDAEYGWETQQARLCALYQKLLPDLSSSRPTCLTT